MQSPIQKFRKSSIIPEKPGILPEKFTVKYFFLKYFLLKSCIHFLLTNVCKWCSGLFLFRLELELFAKTKKDLVSTHSKEPEFLYFYQ